MTTIDILFMYITWQRWIFLLKIMSKKAWVRTEKRYFENQLDQVKFDKIVIFLNHLMYRAYLKLKICLISCILYKVHFLLLWISILLISQFHNFTSMPIHPQTNPRSTPSFLCIIWKQKTVIYSVTMYKLRRSCPLNDSSSCWIFLRLLIETCVSSLVSFW